MILLHAPAACLADEHCGRPLPALSIAEGRDEDEVQGEGLWGAAVMSADMIASGQIDVTGKTVLELGAGCGVAGLAASVWGGATKVYLTDIAQVAAPG